MPKIINGNTIEARLILQTDDTITFPPTCQAAWDLVATKAESGDPNYVILPGEGEVETLDNIKFQWVIQQDDEQFYCSINDVNGMDVEFFVQ